MTGVIGLVSLRFNYNIIFTMTSEMDSVWFEHIYLTLIAKQVLATYINHFRVRFLEPTSTGVV
jgi:hypothetical protein